MNASSHRFEGPAEKLNFSARKQGPPSKWRWTACAAWVVVIGFAGAATAGDVAPTPELPSGWTPKALVYANTDMVVAANPLAVDAGLLILRWGGSAVDAAIAAQMVLNLVEPQSSGIGGGAFMLHYAAASKQLDTYDGRETAPARATPELFLDADGKPLEFLAAVIGGRSVGTPGLLRLLEMAHREHGRLPWGLLFVPAINLAFDGFAISPRLATALAGDPAICKEAPAKDYFCDPDGTPKQVGTRLRNPEFGRTLRAIATGGADPFYRGRIAHDIVAKVRSHPSNPGRLSMKDLADYRARKRPPLCGSYRGQWRICGMGMPSSGATTVLATLGILENFDLAALAPQSAPAVHLISEAYRLAYADRAKYAADSDFIAVPVGGMIDKTYLRGRAALIARSHSMGTPQAGTPPGAMAAGGADNALDIPATSHLSIIDRRGNVVSMTTSIESGFGSHQMVHGFLLNNQLTDFSLSPVDAAGNPIANRVAAGKRPRSSMSPTVVFDVDGRVRMIIGSPGGSNIIQYVTKTLFGVLDWKLDLQQAIDLGNFGAQTSPTTVLEEGNAVALLAEPLAALGHRVAIIAQNSGLHGISLMAESERGWQLAGAADPRREGVAKGDSDTFAPAAIYLPRAGTMATH
jgi:gamma-glutamyltranspeptidase/glutathione hydrolase